MGGGERDRPSRLHLQHRRSKPRKVLVVLLLVVVILAAVVFEKSLGY